MFTYRCLILFLFISGKERDLIAGKQQVRFHTKGISLMYDGDL